MPLAIRFGSRLAATALVPPALGRIGGDGLATALGDFADVLCAAVGAAGPALAVVLRIFFFLVVFLRCKRPMFPFSPNF